MGIPLAYTTRPLSFLSLHGRFGKYVCLSIGLKDLTSQPYSALTTVAAGAKLFECSHRDHRQVRRGVRTAGIIPRIGASQNVSLSTKLKIMGTVTKENGPRELVTHVAKLIYSTSESYVLRRDLSIPLVPRPEAKVPIRVRALEPRDLPQIETERPDGLLMGVIRSGLKQCYVAVTNDDEVCFLQWLITHEQRDRIKKIRFREMHMFDDDTVMLEFSYTFKRFRGLGIMAPAVAWVAEQDPAGALGGHLRRPQQYRLPAWMPPRRLLSISFDQR